MWGRSRSTVLVVGHGSYDPALRATFLVAPGVRLIFSDGPDAAERAERERPQLIVQDVGDGGNGALELCRHLKQDPRTRTLPVLLVAPVGERSRVLDAGADALIWKPVDEREYYDVVRRFVRLPERQHVRVQVNLRFTYCCGELQGQAFSRDLSKSGVALRTDRALAPASRVDLEFALPDGGPPIRCCGVVRYQDARQPREGTLGLEFDGLTAADRERLEAFISRHTGRSLLPRWVASRL
ncbi:MAG TPA: PilZ domain-containing protein [Candidatus Polarisedimenticolaceae bacterium]|nr:PilZ domain-containing protein [Candidatus Polarisedimenticolaceae bacterium]